MIGLVETIVAAFNPFWTYNRLKLDNKIHLNHIVAFSFLVIFATLSFHLLSPFAYSTSNITIVRSLSFFIGFGLRIIVVAYTLSIVVSAITKKQFRFNTAFPIVIFASSTLLFPFLIYWINPEVYIYADHASLFWYSIIIAIGIWKKTEMTFIRSFLATIVAVLLFWLISVTFLPYGMKI